MVLHLAVTRVPVVQELFESDPGDGLPEHESDGDAELLREMLFADTDILRLYDAASDGGEDPEDDVNAELGMGTIGRLRGSTPSRTSDRETRTAGFAGSASSALRLR